MSRIVSIESVSTCCIHTSVVGLLLDEFLLKVLNSSKQPYISTDVKYPIPPSSKFENCLISSTRVAAVQFMNSIQMQTPQLNTRSSSASDLVSGPNAWLGSAFGATPIGYAEELQSSQRNSSECPSSECPVPNNQFQTTSSKQPVPNWVE